MDFETAFYDASKPLSYLRQSTIDKFVVKAHDQMKEYLKGHKNKQIAKVPLYEPFTDFGWEYNNEEEVPQYIYEHIPAGIIEDLDKLLTKAGLKDHVSEIASILQTWYCRQMLYDLDKDQLDNNKKFDEQFQALYEMLGDEIQEIKVMSHNRSASIKNGALINLLRMSYVESILKLPTVIDYIDNLNQWGQYEDKPGDQIRQGAALNILIYLQTQTEYTYKASKENIIDCKFSNKQLLLIYQLMEIAKIKTNQKNEKLIDSDASNLIRNYIKRSIIKVRDLLKLFENPRPQSVTEFKYLEDKRVLKLFEEEDQRKNDSVKAISNNIEKISRMN
jgi:hypothetical protein